MYAKIEQNSLAPMAHSALNPAKIMSYILFLMNATTAGPVIISTFSKANAFKIALFTRASIVT